MCKRNENFADTITFLNIPIQQRKFYLFNRIVQATVKPCKVIKSKKGKQSYEEKNTANGCKENRKTYL